MYIEFLSLQPKPTDKYNRCVYSSILNPRSLPPSLEAPMTGTVHAAMHHERADTQVTCQVAYYLCVAAALARVGPAVGRL